MTWILILSMFATGSAQDVGPYAAAAISPIPGFHSKEACEDAGRAFQATWRQQNTRHSDDGSQGGIARYTCVSQKPAPR